MLDIDFHLLLYADQYSSRFYSTEIFDAVDAKCLLGYLYRTRSMSLLDNLLYCELCILSSFISITRFFILTFLLLSIFSLALLTMVGSYEIWLTFSS